ncbi:MAG: amidase [Acidobacteria bacterium]|nr:amidase [Acidobacteriota bacterium]MBI3428034.1 amidase [Acidobacteriota bacterium]
MAPFNELTWLDATAQAALVRRGEVTPLELVDAAIRRIEQINPQLNAVITPMFDLARAAAQQPPSVMPQGPFTGVPFLLKDLQAAYEGVPMSAGSRWLRNFKPNGDSELVKRYKRAGLLVVGKTNTPEFGLLPTTEPEAFGATRNPWDVTRTPGGSSGGSAAAVAAGMTAFAHANDGGGSIRIPAACCGLFGLKPTRGRNPLGPHFGDIFGGLVVEHAVTRSVRDSAALLDATAGYDPGDPYIAPVPARPFLHEAGAPPGQLRIAFSTQAYTGAPVHPACVAAVQDAAKLCTDLGHEVTEAAPQLHGEMLSKAFFTVWAAGCAWTIDSYSFAVGGKPTAEDIEPLTRVIIELGRKRTAPEYLLAVQTLQIFARRVAQFMASYDVFLTPVLAEPPLPLGTLAPTAEDAMAGMKRSGLFTPFTALQNMTGQPAMSVPLYWPSDGDAAGLPLGVQFAGRYGDEATLFRLAAQLEAARPWADKHPPVSA